MSRAPVGNVAVEVETYQVPSTDEGLAAITFDLRGVGKTNGKSTWTGLDEVADAEAVCNWAVGKPLEAKNILLAGSSAGACIAGSALERVEGVAAYVGIGYPFGNSASLFFRRHFENVLTSTKPKVRGQGRVRGGGE
eukprot:jgi/Mesvir1/24444/Mv13630-RA.1